MNVLQLLCKYSTSYNLSYFVLFYIDSRGNSSLLTASETIGIDHSKRHKLQYT